MIEHLKMLDYESRPNYSMLFDALDGVMKSEKVLLVHVF